MSGVDNILVVVQVCCGHYHCRLRCLSGRHLGNTPVKRRLSEYSVVREMEKFTISICIIKLQGRGASVQNSHSL